ncbi:TPA: hypothetical protein OQX68_003218 [Escherichia coli]|nr:hypothetical protein [Escherichia coli]MDF8277859.1 hypothetical protein [Escherichia coli]HCS3966847.1 hypothetical protein [Escherichia coli]HEA2061401.1 hypothetical protein [Escherichia coli]
MFDKETYIENKAFTVRPFDPANLRLITDRENKSFIFQTECIVAVEPRQSFGDPMVTESDVILANDVRIRVSLSPSDVFRQLSKNTDL